MGIRWRLPLGSGVDQIPPPLCRPHVPNQIGACTFAAVGRYSGGVETSVSRWSEDITASRTQPPEGSSMGEADGVHKHRMFRWPRPHKPIRSPDVHFPTITLPRTSDRHPPIPRFVAQVVLNWRLNFGPDAWITDIMQFGPHAISIHSTDCFGGVYRQDLGAPILENRSSCICVDGRVAGPERTLELHT